MNNIDNLSTEDIAAIKLGSDQVNAGLTTPYSKGYFNDDRDIIVKKIVDILVEHNVKIEDGMDGLIFTHKDTWFSMDDLESALSERGDK